MSATKSVFILFMLGVLVSCTSPYRTSYVSDFSGVEDPPMGFARLYILRPAFSSKSINDTPIMTIDDNYSVELSADSYVALTIPSGKHRLVLSPNAFESDIWGSSFQFSVEKDKKYFVAIWNEVEHSSAIRFIPITNPVLFFIPIDKTVIRNKRLHIELVNEKEATPLLELSRKAKNVIYN